MSVENVITLGKLIGLLFLFCLPLLSILFLKTKRNDLARPVMGTIFLVYVYVIARAGVIFGISRVVGIAAVKSHEAKPSVISPLYRKRVEYIPEFHDCPCYKILIPWHTTGALYHFFSRWYVIFHVGM